MFCRARNKAQSMQERAGFLREEMKQLQAMGVKVSVTCSLPKRTESTTHNSGLPGWALLLLQKSYSVDTSREEHTHTHLLNDYHTLGCDEPTHLKAPLTHICFAQLPGYWVDVRRCGGCQRWLTLHQFSHISCHTSLLRKHFPFSSGLCTLHHAVWLQ